MSKLHKEVKITNLIVPDVHERIVRLKKILASERYADIPVTFLGDWMDSFDGLTWQTHETIKWLRDNISNPKYTFLWGNHDMQYAFPFDGVIFGAGFDNNKLAIVREHLTDNAHWKKFKLLHWIDTPGDAEPGNAVRPQEWLLSHAGLHSSFLHPIYGFSKSYLQDLEENTMWRLRYCQEITSPIAAGRGRGGIARVGGLTWLDWDTEFQPVGGLCQIVGHSGDNITRCKRNGGWRADSINYCIDTHLRHVVEIRDDGTIKIVKAKVH